MKCERLSDRMPLVARGQATWSGEEQSHLERCADCGVEWRIVEAAARIVTALPPEFSAERTGARVLQRLATEPARGAPSRRWWVAGVGIAAAALWVIILLPRDQSAGTVVTQQDSAWTIPVMGLDNLDEEQLRVVLESLDETLETPTQPMIPSLMDLDDQELERVLRSLEG